MKLNLLERILIMQILPDEGNFVTLKITQDLKNALAPTEEEFKRYDIKQEGNNTTWNEKGFELVEIKIGEKAQDIIKDALKKLDKAEKLNKNHLSIYKKFIDDDNV